MLRAKAKRLVGLFYYATRAVGSVLGRLRLIRRRNAVKVLGRMKLYIRIWIRRRRSHHRELLYDFLSLVLYQKQQWRIMERWLQQMHRIRSFLLFLVQRQKAQVELIVLQWERYEAETMQEVKRRGRRVTLSQRNVATEVPRYIKEMQSARLYRILQFRFLKQLKAFWKQPEDTESEEHQIRPRFTAFLEMDDLVTLHRNALKTRHMWDTSMYHPTGRKV